MISHMPGPICVRLSGIVGGRWEIVLSQNVDIENLSKLPCIAPSLITHNNSLGFEDWRCATLLNFLARFCFKLILSHRYTQLKKCIALKSSALMRPPPATPERTNKLSPRVATLFRKLSTAAAAASAVRLLRRPL